MSLLYISFLLPKITKVDRYLWRTVH